MNIKKLSGTFAVAVSLLALNSVAMAGDCSVQSTDIKDQAVALRCEALGNGTYVGDPIWQYRGKGEKGCVVHEKLAKLLDELRTEEPPQQKKGNNKAKGAANDLDDHKYQSAIDQLQRFWDTIEYDAVLNPDNPGAVDAAALQQEWAVDMQTQILACSTP